ncbi:ABC transporter ATP-binding protein [Mucilaginibacter sp. UR6-1]|uniref:ATP-binding cassette domain-containing protein n=1 Tax=Mucilaginibacter sp. UR6-1 TaxID=1435643 RepID=UPI001E31D801|nr:ABC transporter ATP-binding protein [Mucilaginibacter sp. UR6-1]MCC8407476.1 ABC transporter ATP-binding protein [Mucilaginibacter sp. UR6-1]
MPSHTLKVDSVQLEFDGRKILQDIYLDCSTGEIVGLLGRNGCGKSSLLRIIFGSLNCSYRYVSIDGHHLQKGYHNNRIAYLPQHNYLPAGIKIYKLAEPFVDPLLWDEFCRQPAFKLHQHKTVNQLSGGELRQLETLMIICSHADFILLDEPFTHISPVQADDLKILIKQCAKTKGVIVTDHQYYNVLDVSDRIILLDNGCTRAVNSAHDLVTYKYLSGI